MPVLVDVAFFYPVGEFHVSLAPKGFNIGDDIIGMRDVLETLGEQFFARIPRNFTKAVVDTKVMAFQIDFTDTDGGLVLNDAKSLGLHPHGLFGFTDRTEDIWDGIGHDLCSSTFSHADVSALNNRKSNR